MYLPMSHPVRVVLREAALGHTPTRAQLDAMAEHDRHLGDGESIGRFRDRLSRAAEEVAELHREDGGIRRSMERADAIAADLAEKMTDGERAASGDANPESLSDISARLFGPR